MGDVSRETTHVPDPPPAAKNLFPTGRWPLVERYAEWLADDGVVRGLIGPREVPRLWERHLLNCAVLEAWVPAQATVADVGSGAGLPGLVLAIARPDVRVSLIEPLLRRTTFLTEVVDDLGLGEQVEVIRARAEGVTDRTFSVVTARAVAPLDRLAGWCLPLVKPGGDLLALKGSSAREELAAATSSLSAHGVAGEVVEAGVGVLSEATCVVRIHVPASGRVGCSSPSGRPPRPDSVRPDEGSTRRRRRRKRT